MGVMLDDQEATLAEFPTELRETADWLESEATSLASAEAAGFSEEMHARTDARDEYLEGEDLLPKPPDPERATVVRMVEHAA